MTPTIKHRIEQLKLGQVPKGYKKTSFGVFPCDWKPIKISDCCSKGEYGINAPAVDYQPDLPKYLRITDIDEDNRFVDTGACVDDENYKKYILKENDIVFARTGASVGKTYLYNCKDGELVYAGFLIKFEINPNMCHPYLLQANCRTKNYVKWVSLMSTRSGQPGINSEEYGKYSFVIPASKTEQEKIAEILMKWDEAIELEEKYVEKLKNYKSICLKKMFPAKGKNIPEWRFKGFSKALPAGRQGWEQRKLGELCERVTRKNKNGESDLPLTIASQDGLIDQRDFFNKVVAANDMSGYYLLKKGEFAYNKSYSNGFDYGSIKRLNAYEQGCLSTIYICFGIISEYIESDYLECFFDTLKWYSDITMICAEGARNHGLLNVDTKAFFEEVTIVMPTNKEEQRKISMYLNTLDTTITLHQRKLEKIKQQRKALQQYLLNGIVRVKTGEDYA